MKKSTMVALAIAALALPACTASNFEYGTTEITTGVGVDENGHGYTTTREITTAKTAYGDTAVEVYGGSLNGGGIKVTRSFDVNCTIFNYCGD